jgi:hypothetical protein
MATANLLLHCGAREVAPEELRIVPCPAPEGRWYPVPHHVVVDHVTNALEFAGYQISHLQLGLARDNQRLFATAILSASLAPGVSLAVGFRSSLDKSISLQWACGNHVFCCDNMCFRSEQIIARKHTVNGVTRYQEAICRAVTGLASFREQESRRIAWMQHHPVDDREAESFLLRCLTDWHLLSPRSLPEALAEWREPSFPGLAAPTAWRLQNAVTYALRPRFKSNPQAAAAATVKLSGLLAPEEPPLHIPVSLAA